MDSKSHVWLSWFSCYIFRLKTANLLHCATETGSADERVINFRKIYTLCMQILNKSSSSYPFKIPNPWKSNSVQYSNWFSDNDKPTVTSSKATPDENKDDVTLTCTKSTSDTLTSYEWFKDNVKINGADKSTYALPDNKRTNSGSYTCKVTVQTRPAATSAAKVVIFRLDSFLSSKLT